MSDHDDHASPAGPVVVGKVTGNVDQWAATPAGSRPGGCRYGGGDLAHSRHNVRERGTGERRDAGAGTVVIGPAPAGSRLGG
jgi:hypothetical protein